MKVKIQLKQMYGIFFPVDDKSLKKIEHGEIELPIRIDYIPFDYKGKLFSTLQTCNIFQVINDTCFINIEKHKEAILLPNKINNAITALNELKLKIYNEEIITFINMLNSLLTDAQKKCMPVFFVM
jgi:hypothetical protein